MPGTIHILLYHDVCGKIAKAASCSNPAYTTPLEKLGYHLRWLSSSKFKIVGLEEWLNARKEGSVWKGHYVILTFDGPHIGWFEHLIPLLLDLGVPATFFVTAGWVGARHPYRESRTLTWEDIVEMTHLIDKNNRKLFDVGCHSMWHTTLERQSSENEFMYHRRLLQEIVEACDLIRARTGLKTRAYTPPKGVGNLDYLRPFFELAGVDSVRWASLPGRKNPFDGDLFDLQISYCDTTDQPFDRLPFVLSRGELGCLGK